MLLRLILAVVVVHMAKGVGRFMAVEMRMVTEEKWIKKIDND